MRPVKIKRKPRIRVTATYEDINAGVNGGCTACGHIEKGKVHPDVEKRRCPQCGKFQLYGLQGLVKLEKINVIDF